MLKKRKLGICLYKLLRIAQFKFNIWASVNKTLKIKETCSESQRSVHLEYLSKCVKAVINLKLTHRCNYYWTTYSLHMCVNLQSSLYTNFKEYLIVYLNTMAVPDLRKLRATFKLCSLKFCYYVLYFYQWHVVKHYPKIQMRA